MEKIFEAIATVDFSQTSYPGSSKNTKPIHIILKLWKIKVKVNDSEEGQRGRQYFTNRETRIIPNF